MRSVKGQPDRENSVINVSQGALAMCLLSDCVHEDRLKKPPKRNVEYEQDQDKKAALITSSSGIKIQHSRWHCDWSRTPSAAK